jgi:biopolymer transport protein ExbB
VRSLWAALLAMTLLLPGWALAQADGQPDQQITNLDQLLQSVREKQQQQRMRNVEREERFLRERNQQRALLAQAQRDFEKGKQENQPLLAVTEANGQEIQRLQEQLQEVVGDMGDFSSTFREFAGDFSAVLQDSMISAQMPDRADELRSLAATTSQPGIEAIQSLWLLVQEEMTESSRIERFEAPVVRVDGTVTQRAVLRIGPFSAFSEGDFLRFVPETGELLVLSRQPAGRYRDAAKEFAEQPGVVSSVSVDPSRGSLLGMLSYTPGLRERIDQGGMIALIIIALGVLGALMAVWRGVYLSMVYFRIRAQLDNLQSPNSANPLGRVLLSVKDIDLNEEELLQLKLDEAVLAEMPALERGNGVIKLLAATSPLLGLLGTVTGMILTFQAISLFGTGDPKLMAGGISQALVTTVLGLVVAIPLLFSHSVIAYLARSMIQRLDEQCAGVLARNAEQQDRVK